MPARSYRDLVLLADVAERDDSGVTAFDVRVFRSPAGEGPTVRRALPDALYRQLGRLDRRKLDPGAVLELGMALADLLLPEALRSLFLRSLDRLGPDEGLRLRLRLPPELASIPWELLCVPRAEGAKDATGCLALDPRISLVRHEALPVAPGAAPQERPPRLLVALASPEAQGYAPLDLDRERQVIEEAVEDLVGLERTVLADATLPALRDALDPGADVFHFAGHGVFEQTGLGRRMGTVIGHGALVLQDEAGAPAHVPAEQLAVNLRGRGVRLVVLGACETAKRDEQQAWSGVVAALMEAGIPAVVAMQHRVWDDAAIAFARALYASLAAGRTVDEAVSAGRLAVFNEVHPRQDGFWREWAVPALYLRAEEEIRLPASPDPEVRAAAAAGLEALVEVRARAIAAGGRYTGLEAGVIEGGRLRSRLSVDEVDGEATLLDAKRVSGGDLSAEAEIGTIGAGSVTGMRLGRVGGAADDADDGRDARMDDADGGAADAPAGPASGATPEPNPEPTPESAAPRPAARRCASCGAALGEDARFCASCGAEAPTGPRFCSHCGAALASGARFCGHCGQAVDGG